MAKHSVLIVFFLLSIVSFLSPQVQQERIPNYGQPVVEEPEILISTSNLGQGWQIYALNPVTGELRQLTNHTADS